MIFKYDIDFSKEVIVEDIERITNQIFKLLPSREEGGDWKTPLQNLIYEITGMKALWIDEPNLFVLLCKLEALLSLDREDDFLVFRKLIFECLSICNYIKKKIKEV